MKLEEDLTLNSLLYKRMKFRNISTHTERERLRDNLCSNSNSKMNLNIIWSNIGVNLCIIILFFGGFFARPAHDISIQVILYICDGILLLFFYPFVCTYRLKIISSPFYPADYSFNYNGDRAREKERGRGEGRERQQPKTLNIVP